MNITSVNPKSIDQLDANLKLESGWKDLHWIDAFDSRLSIRGLAWLQDNIDNRNFRRIPERLASRLPTAVAELSQCTAGVFISFMTDSTDISLRMQVANTIPMMHMPATGMAGAELLCREEDAWFPVATIIPSPNETTFRRDIFEDASPKKREFRVYLPLYKGVIKLEIGVAHHSTVTPLPATTRKPIIFYGTSITQGGCANTAASDYVSTLGRLLDTEVINFGFSGNGKGEPEMAHLISEIDAEVFVLDHIANASLETLPEMLAAFIDILRCSHPFTPIVIMGMPGYNHSLWNNNTKITIEKKFQTALNIYSKAKSNGDSNIHLIDGREILPPGITGAYVDGVHPTSHGFALMAERLAPILKSIITNSSRKF